MCSVQPVRRHRPVSMLVCCTHAWTRYYITHFFSSPCWSGHTKDSLCSGGCGCVLMKRVMRASRAPHKNSEDYFDKSTRAPHNAYSRSKEFILMVEHFTKSIVTSGFQTKQIRKIAMIRILGRIKKKKERLLFLQRIQGQNHSLRKEQVNK